jgi:hypothetical protein
MKDAADASEDAISLNHYNNTIRLEVMENGSATQDPYSASSGTTYYITLSRDDDGGENSTGQVTAEIRTGSHTGTLQETLTVDCAAGEQNDFQYLYVPSCYDDGASQSSDGFIRNLDVNA